MNSKLILIITGIALMASCVTSSDIVPVGKDSYLITGRASGGLNAGKGLIQATQRANTFCWCAIPRGIRRSVYS